MIKNLTFNFKNMQKFTMFIKDSDDEDFNDYYLVETDKKPEEIETAFQIIKETLSDNSLDRNNEAILEEMLTQNIIISYDIINIKATINVIN